MSLWSRIERRLSDFAGELLPDDFRLKLTAARDLIDRGELADACEVLDDLLRERPEHPGALSLYGAAKLELGDLEAAEALFTRALAQRTDMPEAMVGLGQASLSLGHTRTAIESFRAAVGAAHGDRMVLALAYRGLGMAHRRAGDLEKAIRELRKAVAENTSDPVARAALGEALLVDDRVSAEEARRHLELSLQSGAAPPLAYLALGRIALEDEDGERAREFFARALDAARQTRGQLAQEAELAALIGLGDAVMLASDTQAAHQYYLQALAMDGRSADIHARIGDVHRKVGSLHEALASYERSLTIQRNVRVLRCALDTALMAEAVDAAVRLANDVLAVDPNDARAMVARGFAMARQGQVDAARATFAAALRHHDDAEAHLALGRLELDADQGRAAGSRAAACALAALRIEPENRRARELLAEARARELGDSLEEVEAGKVQADPSHMYRLAERFGRIALARTGLADLAGEAARAAADFDQPLLVTVMGEFSSGKSSFVNAFIGEEVAPTGITPTTATINVVKYGRERGGRIAYRDGRIETLGLGELFASLQKVNAARARAIEVVEILLPLAELERVNIVDTPGLNSILPEHEEVARGFIARADAVIWLFTASQAGKASERRALESIRKEGKRVLGVLNKMDQLSEKDTAELIAYVQGELEDIVELVVPFSARRALEHKRGVAEKAPPADGDGNWQVLATALEERFFAQARELKRDACSRRLASLLERAQSVISAQHTQAAEVASALAGHAQRMRDAGTEFIERVVVEQRMALGRAVQELYGHAAREVLELVRPRELPFGSHSATPADRDYLLSLLDTGYEAALERSRREVVATLQRHSQSVISAIARAVPVLGNQVVSDIVRTADDAVRLVEAQVFDRTRAYVRGYMHGGYVSSFFRHELPRLELDEDTVYRALVRDSLDLDAEIAVRLAEAGASALQALARRLEHWAGVATVMAYDIETGIGRALEAIELGRRLTSARE